MQRFALNVPIEKSAALRWSISLYLLYCWVDLVRNYGVRWFTPGFPRGFALLPEWALLSPWIEVWQFTGILGPALLLSRRFARWGALFSWLWLFHLAAGTHLFYEIHFDYLGWMLIGFVLLPDLARLERLALWVIGISYTTGGAIKLTSAAWLQGDALQALLPAGRLGGLGLPLQLVTFAVAILQLAGLPLVAFPRSAPWGWLLLTLLQVSLLTLFKIEWITIPMLLFHALAFQRAWMAKSRWKAV